MRKKCGAFTFMRSPRALKCSRVGSVALLALAEQQARGVRSAAEALYTA
jgi:hypothetical protein